MGPLRGPLENIVIKSLRDALAQAVDDGCALSALAKRAIGVLHGNGPREEMEEAGKVALIASAWSMDAEKFREAMRILPARDIPTSLLHDICRINAASGIMWRDGRLRRPDIWARKEIVPDFLADPVTFADACHESEAPHNS